MFKNSSSIPLQQHFIPVFFHYFEAAIKYSHLLSASFWQSRKKISSYTLIIPHSTLSVQDKKQQPHTASIIHTFTADHFQNLIGVPSSAAKFHQKFTSYFRQGSIPIISPAVFRPFFRIFAVWGRIIFLSLHTMLLSVFRLTKKHPAENLSSSQKLSRFLFEDFLAAKAYFSAFFALLIFTMP